MIKGIEELQKDCRLLIRFLFLLMISVLSLSCRKTDPVRLGLIVELSGPFRDLGIEGRDGALMAMEEINREGGIKGRPLELVLADCGYSRDQAKQAFQELLDEHIKIMLGPMTSTQGMVLLPMINEEEEVLCIGITPSSEKFGGRKDNFYRVTPSTDQMAKDMVLYLTATGFNGTLGIVFDEANAEYSQSVVRGMHRGMDPLYNPIPKDYPFDSRTRNFLQVMEEVAKDSPDAVYLVSSARDTAFLAQYGRVLGYTGQYYSSFWAGTDDLLEKGGSNIEGLILPGFYTEDDLKGTYGGFRERFVTRYGRNPSYFSVFGYEAVYLVFDAYKKGELPFTGSAMSFKGFEPYEGIVGTITFDEYGDCLRIMKMVRISNGRFMRDNSLGDSP